MKNKSNVIKRISLVFLFLIIFSSILSANFSNFYKGDDEEAQLTKEEGLINQKVSPISSQYIWKRMIDMTDPIITDTPHYLEAELGYSGQYISWTATDPNPSSYTVELQGSGLVVGPTSWTSDLAITYNIPEGFTLRNYLYIVNFTNDYGNFTTDSVTFRVIEDTTKPKMLSYHTHKIVDYGYIRQSLSWAAADLNPNTYTIELSGSGIVAGPTDWTSGVEITYDIPDKLEAGNYYYTATFTDDYGNSNWIKTIFTVKEREGGIPAAGFEIILMMSIGTVATMVIMTKKKSITQL